MTMVLFELKRTRVAWVPSALAVFLAVIASPGCQPSTSTQVATANVSESTPEEPKTPVVISPQSYEATAEQLLEARLPLSETSEGWIRLFDGHTLFGWEITGKANWRVEDGAIVVDQGEKCFLCTSMPWQDYELKLEFQADETTNSGVFLRTPLDPQDPASDCYEVNIAPDDNPFPTASVVQRQRVDEKAAPKQVANEWRNMTMRIEGDRIQVFLDEQLVTEYTDSDPIPTGRIGLQHNQGRVAFQNIRLRPLGLQPLLDQELSQWTKYPSMPGTFEMTQENVLHVQGGRTQLESKESFANFALLTDYKTATPATNSGIFFRCIPGDEMMGYECQVSNEMKDNMPTVPADCGAGGIFRRQDARVVAGNLDDWSSLLLVANGPKMAAWVNGIQVSDWQDDRKPDPNPRKGMRLEAGTIMIQGHDPSTEAWFRNLSIKKLDTQETANEEAQPNGEPADNN